MSTELTNSQASHDEEEKEIDLNSEHSQSKLSELDAIKPARSGYMLFGKEHRKQIGQCGSVSEQSKRISALWNALNDEEKGEWSTKVDEQKQKYEKYLEDHPLVRKLLNLQEQQKKAHKSSSNMSFQNGTIKKMILRDPDINRISKEALIIINNATKLFIQHLVNTVNDEETSTRSSKTMTEKDFVNTLRSNTKYMFIRHVFQKNTHSVSGIKRNNNNKNDSDEPPKKRAKHNNGVNNGTKITQFFNQT